MITFLTLNYRTENLTMKWSDKRKIESDEMMFLRSMAGFTIRLNKKYRNTQLIKYL